MFHSYREAFIEHAHHLDIDKRYCKQWSNPRSREIFRAENGGRTLYPTVKTTGLGNIFQIAADRRWAFKLLNAPGELRRPRTRRPGVPRWLLTALEHWQ